MSDLAECIQCLRSFRRILKDQVFCCRQCSAKYNRVVNKIKDDNGEPIPRLCIVCEKTYFIPHGVNHRICSPECRKEEIRDVAYAYWVAHKQKAKKKDDKLVCRSCKHWADRPDSDTGGECLISRWLICKPYLSTSKPYAPKDKI